MLSRRQRGEAAQLTADRRRREDEAPRLRAEVPRLSSLRLDIGEGRSDGARAGTEHIRRIVVEHAPALFVMRCSDSDCKSGGVHDLTHAIMTDLRRGATRFEGRIDCDGCACVLRYVATASYAEVQGDTDPPQVTGGSRR